jgi:hypothetical protein
VLLPYHLVLLYEDKIMLLTGKENLIKSQIYDCLYAYGNNMYL